MARIVEPTNVDTNLVYKILAAFGSLWAIVSSAVYFPLRKRVNELEELMRNTYSKPETVEAIELRRQPIEHELKKLNQNTERLSECVRNLTYSISSLQQWQAKQEGRQERD